MRDLLRETQLKDLEEAQLFGRGNGRGFYSQGPLERNERYRQVEEWSDLASDGRRRNDAPISSPTAHSQQSRTPPTPAPSEDTLYRLEEN